MTTNTKKFGVEIEAYNVERNALIAGLTAAGIAVEYAGYTHSVTSYWKIVSDGSIDHLRDAFELVSPILEGEAGLAELRKVGEVLTALGAKVSKETGLHVHVDARSMDLGAIKNVARMWVKYEPCMDSVMPDSRKANTYCKSILSRFMSLGDAYEQIGKAATTAALRALLNPGHSAGRYHKLNLHSLTRHGTLEFRQHSGTVDPDKMVNWVKLVTAFVVDAAKYQTVRRDKVDHSFENMLKVVPDATVKKFYRARRAALANTAEAS